MAYRNGTYVAFDGLDTTNPTIGDIKYFNMLKMWKNINSKSLIDFKFSDSHQKTSQVRDTSSRNTLERVLLERLKNSKNMVLILTEKTRYDREMLNYEIEKAIKMNLPIIVCYPKVRQPIFNPKYYSDYWPLALAEGIRKEEVQCIHIPFKKKPVLDAIPRFHIHSNEKLESLGFYNKDAYDFFNITWE